MKKLSFVFVIALILAGCKKEGCTDTEATNFLEKAKVDDGSCTYMRDDFIGVYTATESCTYEENGTFTVKVLEGPNSNEVVIENLYKLGERVRAIVANNEASFKESVGGITYEGTAYMLGSELNIDYQVCETDYYPCSDIEECSIIGVK